jgi:DNA-binding response OmpR family regulator
MARIVVIDAVYDAAQLAKRVLEESGHRAAGFDDETDALESLRQTPADLVVFDPRLKRSDGMAVLRRIRRLSPQMRVLVLTADSTKRARQEALRSGADAYCVKPIENDVLVNTVERLLADGN